MVSFRAHLHSAVYAPPLVQNLLQDFPLVDEFYEYDPTEAESYIRRAEYLSKNFKTDRKTISAELVRYNRQIGADSAAVSNAELLERSDAVALLTGQQAGIATGPLYTIHKAITVIRKARVESERLQRPVIPVFWVASEDHDWNEIQFLSLLTQDGSISKLGIDFVPEVKSSVGAVQVPEAAVLEWLQKLQEVLQDTEFKPIVLEELTAAWKRTGNMADWFAAFMARLFQDTGLVFVNPMTKTLREAVKHRFAEFILENRRYVQAVESGTAKLHKAGYPVQVEVMKNSALLFLEQDGARSALEVSEDGQIYTVRGTSIRYTRQQMLDLVYSEPERFSPNVLLRPLIQDTLFPTLGYVGGPAEISYHAMIRGVYETAEEQMSILIPRFQFTIVEKAQDRILEKYGFQPRDFLKRASKPVDQVLAKADTLRVDDRFEELKQEVQQKIEALTQDLQSLDPGAVQLGQEAVTGTLHRIEQFHGKTKQLFRKRHDTIIKQFERVEAALAPRGHLQERELNVLSYLVKYGPTFVRDLLESVPDNGFGRMTDLYIQ